MCISLKCELDKELKELKELKENLSFCKKQLMNFIAETISRTTAYATDLIVCI